MPTDCSHAQIISPQGAESYQDAANFHVSNTITISWQPADCVMVVQYYQNGELRDVYREAHAGVEINLGAASSGAIEIKIWQAGLSQPADHTWVWVDSSPASAPPTDTPGSSDCSHAQIISPQGAESYEDAANFHVSNKVTISWQPADCVLIVQYYQQEALQGEYRDVRSGMEMKLGAAGSGATELKIWKEGFSEPVDNTWVWVE